MKTVLVTGSSSGLGKSIIEKYASNGYNTIITYLTHENEALKFNEYIKNKYKQVIFTCLQFINRLNLLEKEKQHQNIL